LKPATHATRFEGVRFHVLTMFLGTMAAECEYEHAVVKEHDVVAAE
jgi:hypothetical protein